VKGARRRTMVGRRSFILCREIQAWEEEEDKESRGSKAPSLYSQILMLVPL
jgi:hypothetical protein